MIKIEQEQTRTNTIAIGFQGTPCSKPLMSTAETESNK